MYGQIYNIPFKSIKNIQYEILIEKKGYTGDSIELTGANNPFIVERHSSEMFDPFNLSSATLRIFGGDYLRTLFTPDPQGVKITLMKTDQVEWVGYLINDTFNQDYTNINFVYEVEVVNPISTLKYKNFDLDEGLYTIAEYIAHALVNTNTMTHYYLPKSITNSGLGNIWNTTKISSNNFYDEMGEGMPWYEVLEEISKYFGLQIKPYQNEVYFIDHLGINKGYNEMWQYRPSNPNGTTVTRYSADSIQAYGYAGDDHKLSINSGKKHIKVTCSMYEVNNVMPKFDNQKAQYLTYNQYSQNIDNDSYVGIHRYYDQPKFKFYTWTRSGSQLIKTDGAYFNNPVNSTGGDKMGGGFGRVATYKKNDVPASLPMDNALIIKAFNDLETAKTGTRLTTDCDVFSMESDKKIIVSNSTYLIISLAWMIRKSEFNMKQEDDTSGNKLMVARLRMGDRWYNGSSWTSTPTNFYIDFKYDKWTKYYNNYIVNENTNTFMQGLGSSEGLVIKADASNTKLTDIEFFIRGATDYVSALQGYGDQYHFIKNIEVKVVNKTTNIYNDWTEGDEDDRNDIVYETDIDEQFMNDHEYINLRICTMPDDYPYICHSTPIIADGNYFRSLNYRSLYLNDVPEKVLIQRIADYYSLPKYELTVNTTKTNIAPYTRITDTNMIGREFMLMGEEINYELEKNKINIKEI